MLTRRSFLKFAGAAAALAPAIAIGSEARTFGPMQARLLGESGGIIRWAYRSQLIDDGPEEYLIDVVLPDGYPGGGPYPILFLGEVEAAPGVRGYGLDLARQMNVHNVYGCILVSSTFKTPPWYGRRSDGSHAVDKHIVQSVFPFVEQVYDGMADREGKLFIGFSKSGWGAVSLILRNPGHFGYAASWDAPWLLPYSRFQSGDAFGTEARFNAHNPLAILKSRVASVNDRERLWISAGKTFLDHHAPMVSALAEHGVPHRSRFVPAPEHRWDPDWLLAGCRALFEMRAA